MTAKGKHRRPIRRPGRRPLSAMRGPPIRPERRRRFSLPPICARLAQVRDREARLDARQKHLDLIFQDIRAERGAIEDLRKQILEELKKAPQATPVVTPAPPKAAPTSPPNRGREQKSDELLPAPSASVRRTARTRQQRRRRNWPAMPPCFWKNWRAAARWTLPSSCWLGFRKSKLPRCYPISPIPTWPADCLKSLENPSPRRPHPPVTQSSRKERSRNFR